MKTVIQIVLVLAIIALAYLCVDSIQRPIRFIKEHKLRSKAVINNLKDIRTAQIAYKSINDRFTGSFDTLIDFVKHDSLKLVKKEGSLSDSLIEAGWTEEKALKVGMIKRDTILVSVLDSLFGKQYPIDSLRYIPFTNKEEFAMGAGVVETGSGVKVKVFEAKVHNNVYLNGLEQQEIDNLSDKTLKLERYPGLKVGSLTETNNNAGNWE
ncbi:hypothetical protein [Saccharicrinis fermentans]|uniref:Uncharacterized protein n=1 Tax=Saccharicrinis fermentans DSM 9555 = JCM 21142 TaxID=869213 RepID=W7YNV9_9BACT|nr:hypothetical protein [Saccharicrinis fermentans]GAF04059.1 hypothetical protein JCM21142_72754 [Saccharicrinis fermentans DSM 9555 = JCM 21142]